MKLSTSHVLKTKGFLWNTPQEDLSKHGMCAGRQEKQRGPLGTSEKGIYLSLFLSLIPTEASQKRNQIG